MTEPTARAGVCQRLLSTAIKPLHPPVSSSSELLSSVQCNLDFKSPVTPAGADDLIVTNAKPIAKAVNDKACSYLLLPVDWLTVSLQVCELVHPSSVRLPHGPRGGGEDPFISGGSRLAHHATQAPGQVQPEPQN